MAGRGVGRGRTGTTRTRAKVEGTLLDSVPATKALPGVALSQIPSEEIKTAENPCSEEVIIIKETTSASAGVPVITNVAAASVPNVSRNGTQGGKRKPLQALNSNAPPSPSSIAASEICEGKGREIAVQQMCDAIDEEVANRSNLIKAIAATQLASITSQMKLKLSRLPVHVQNMPLSEYLKSCPNIEAKEMDDGRIQLKKASPCALLLRDSKKNLSEILSKVRDNPSDEPSSLFKTPAFGPTKTFVNQFPSCTSEELSWAEYLAKQQALGRINGYAASSETHHQQESAVILKSCFWRGTTPKTVRIPKEGEMLLSVNGSPLVNAFTPGPDVGNMVSGKKLRGTRVTRSTTKRSLRDF